jgi:hypothetical protein
MKTVKNCKLGLSLLEIIMAINATALLMALLCQTVPLARRQLHETEVRMSGALLAQNAIEEYLTVPLAEWPQQPIRMEGDWRTVRLTYQPWQGESGQASDKLVRVTAVVLAGQEERYRLETVAFR